MSASTDAPQGANGDAARGGRPGKPARTTQADVASRAGVSVATVSFVLNGRPGKAHPTSAATRERILAAAHELDYRPHRAGRSLRRGRAELVAIVHPPPTTPWIEELSRQLERAAEPRGHSVIHLLMHSTDGAQRTVDVLANGLVDAAIVVGGGLSGAQRSHLVEHGLVLTVVSETVRSRRFDVVAQHASEGLRRAVHHLAESGRRRIAFLGNDDSLRLAGYRKGLQECDLAFEAGLYAEAGESRDQMLQTARTILQRRPRPDAVLGATDRAAIAALWAARSLDLAVPTELAVIGAGNTPEARAVQPALTTVGPVGLDFSTVIDRLFDRINDPGLPGRTIHTPWELVPRGSA